MNQDGDQPAGPLNHLRVLDLSRVLAGPWAAQILGDLGAEVIKVENPRGGDDTRHWGPPFLEDADGQPGDAAYFTASNRNKRSVCIDFGRPAGADLVRRLAACSDVVIENFKVGALARYGLDAAALRAQHRGLIYCSITGFGQSGPYAQRAGYDFLIQGMGGLMSITGQPDGHPGAEPLKVGVAISDLFTGMYAATSILAALAHRERTGEGQTIDCSLLDAQVAMLANQASNWLVGGVVPTRMGNNHPNVVPYRAYPTMDGHVIVACGNDSQFRRLCAALDLPAAAADPRFATNAGRIAHRGALDALLSERLSTRPRAAVIAALEAAGVAAGPINTVAEVFADPHVEARGALIEMARDDGTRIQSVGFPARLSATPASYRRAPPALGADTVAVLRDLLGLGDEERQTLGREGIIT